MMVCQRPVGRGRGRRNSTPPHGASVAFSPSPVLRQPGAVVSLASSAINELSIGTRFHATTSDFVKRFGGFLQESVEGEEVSVIWLRRPILSRTILLLNLFAFATRIPIRGQCACLANVSCKIMG